MNNQTAQPKYTLEDIIASFKEFKKIGNAFLDEEKKSKVFSFLNKKQKKQPTQNETELNSLAVKIALYIDFEINHLQIKQSGFTTFFNETIETIEKELEVNFSDKLKHTIAISAWSTLADSIAKGRFLVGAAEEEVSRIEQFKKDLKANPSLGAGEKDAMKNVDENIKQAKLKLKEIKQRLA